MAEILPRNVTPNMVICVIFVQLLGQISILLKFIQQVPSNCILFANFSSISLKCGLNGQKRCILGHIIIGHNIISSRFFECVSQFCLLLWHRFIFFNNYFATVTVLISQISMKLDFSLKPKFFWTNFYKNIANFLAKIQPKSFEA